MSIDFPLQNGPEEDTTPDWLKQWEEKNQGIEITDPNQDGPFDGWGENPLIEYGLDIQDYTTPAPTSENDFINQQLQEDAIARLNVDVETVQEIRQAEAEATQAKQVDEYYESLINDIDDLERLQSMGSYHAANHGALAKFAIQTYNSEDEEIREVSQYILHMLKDYEPFKDFILKETNGSVSFDNMYVAPEKPNSFMRAVGWLFGELDAPLQGVYKFVDDVIRGDFASAGASVADFGIDFYQFLTPDGTIKSVADFVGIPENVANHISGGSLFEAAEDFVGQWESSEEDFLERVDRNEDGRADFFEAYRIPDDFGKDVGLGWFNAGNALTLIGDITHDPYTWGSLGLGTLGKQAMSSIVRVAGTKTSAKIVMDVAEAGLKSGKFKKLVELPEAMINSGMRIISEGLQSRATWKALREKIVQDLGKDILDDLAEAMLVAAPKIGTGVKQVKWKNKAAARGKRYGTESPWAQRATTKADKYGEAGQKVLTRNPTDKAVANLQKRIAKQLKVVKNRSGGGAGLGHGRYQLRLPGTRAAYQFYKRSGMTLGRNQFVNIAQLSLKLGRTRWAGNNANAAVATGADFMAKTRKVLEMLADGRPRSNSLIQEDWAVLAKSEQAGQRVNRVGTGKGQVHAQASKADNTPWANAEKHGVDMSGTIGKTGVTRRSFGEAQVTKYVDPEIDELVNIWEDVVLEGKFLDDVEMMELQKKTLTSEHREALGVGPDIRTYDDAARYVESKTKDAQTVLRDQPDSRLFLDEDGTPLSVPPVNHSYYGSTAKGRKENWVDHPDAYRPPASMEKDEIIEMLDEKVAYSRDQGPDGLARQEASARIELEQSKKAIAVDQKAINKIDTELNKLTEAEVSGRHAVKGTQTKGWKSLDQEYQDGIEGYIRADQEYARATLNLELVSNLLAAVRKNGKITLFGENGAIPTYYKAHREGAGTKFVSRGKDEVTAPVNKAEFLEKKYQLEDLIAGRKSDLSKFDAANPGELTSDLFARRYSMQNRIAMLEDDLDYLVYVAQADEARSRGTSYMVQKVRELEIKMKDRAKAAEDRRAIAYRDLESLNADKLMRDFVEYVGESVEFQRYLNFPVIQKVLGDEVGSVIDDIIDVTQKGVRGEGEIFLPGRVLPRLKDPDKMRQLVELWEKYPERLKSTALNDVDTYILASEIQGYRQKIFLHDVFKMMQTDSSIAPVLTKAGKVDKRSKFAKLAKENDINLDLLSLDDLQRMTKNPNSIKPMWGSKAQYDHWNTRLGEKTRKLEALVTNKLEDPINDLLSQVNAAVGNKRKLLFADSDFKAFAGEVLDTIDDPVLKSAYRNWVDMPDGARYIKRDPNAPANRYKVSPIEESRGHFLEQKRKMIAVLNKKKANAKILSTRVDDLGRQQGLTNKKKLVSKKTGEVEYINVWEELSKTVKRSKDGRTKYSKPEAQANQILPNRIAHGELREILHQLRHMGIIKRQNGQWVIGNKPKQSIVDSPPIRFRELDDVRNGAKADVIKERMDELTDEIKDLDRQIATQQMPTDVGGVKLQNLKARRAELEKQYDALTPTPQDLTTQQRAWLEFLEEGNAPPAGKTLVGAKEEALNHITNWLKGVDEKLSTWSARNRAIDDELAELEKRIDEIKGSPADKDKIEIDELRTNQEYLTRESELIEDFVEKISARRETLNNYHMWWSMQDGMHVADGKLVVTKDGKTVTLMQPPMGQNYRLRDGMLEIIDDQGRVVPPTVKRGGPEGGGWGLAEVDEKNLMPEQIARDGTPLSKYAQNHVPEEKFYKLAEQMLDQGADPYLFIQRWNAMEQFRKYHHGIEEGHAYRELSITRGLQEGTISEGVGRSIMNVDEASDTYKAFAADEGMSYSSKLAFRISQLQTKADDLNKQIGSRSKFDVDPQLTDDLNKVMAELNPLKRLQERPLPVETLTGPIQQTDRLGPRVPGGTDPNPGVPFQEDLIARGFMAVDDMEEFFHMAGKHHKTMGSLLEEIKLDWAVDGLSPSAAGQQFPVGGHSVGLMPETLMSAHAGKGREVIGTGRQYGTTNVPEMLKPMRHTTTEKVVPTTLMQKTMSKTAYPFVHSAQWAQNKLGWARSMHNVAGGSGEAAKRQAREVEGATRAAGIADMNLRLKALDEFPNEIVSVMKKVMPDLTDQQLYDELISYVSEIRGHPGRMLNPAGLESSGRSAKYGEIRDKFPIKQFGDEGLEIWQMVRRLVEMMDEYSIEQWDWMRDTVTGKMGFRDPVTGRITRVTDVDPTMYNPRIISAEAFNKIAKLEDAAEGGNAAAKEQWSMVRGMLDEKTLTSRIDTLYQAGKLTKSEAQSAKDGLPGIIDALINPTQYRAMTGKMGDEQVVDILRKSGRFQTRDFLPNVENVVKVNDTVRKIFDDLFQVVDDVDWTINNLYEVDPVQAFIRYSSEMDPKRIIYDVMEEFEEVKLFDGAWGDGAKQMERPAAINGRATTKHLDNGSERHTFTFVDPVDNTKISLSSFPEEKIETFMDRVKTESAFDGKYKPIDVGQTWKLVDNDIAAELMDNVIPKIMGDVLPFQFLRSLNVWTSGWASYVTVLKPAFHMRNEIGNIFNMLLGGFKNPMLLGDAMRMQYVMKQTRTHMQKGGFADFDSALDDLYRQQEAGFEIIGREGYGHRKATIKENDLTTLGLARDHGVIGTSFFNDLTKDVEIFDRTSLNNTLNNIQSSGRGKVQRAYVNNSLTRFGRATGTFFEDNARLAMFMDGLEQGMSPAMSSTRVKDYLFDYGDLTKAEESVKAVSRFYTWMRKNTALQARMLVTNPGSVLAKQKILHGIFSNMFGMSDYVEGLFMPDWYKDNGFFISPNDMYMARMETPLVSAIETMEKFGWLINFGNINQWFFDMIGQEELGEVLSVSDVNYPDGFTGNRLRMQIDGLLDVFANGPKQVLDLAIDLRSENFMSQKFKASPQKQLLYNAINAAFPVLGQYSREVAKLGAGDWMDLVPDHQELDPKKDKDGWKWRLASFFGGINLYHLNEEQQLSYIGNIKRNWDSIIDQAKRDDFDIPPWEELVDQGKVEQRNEYLHKLIYHGANNVDVKMSMATLIPEKIKHEYGEEWLGLPLDVIMQKDKTMEEFAQDILEATLAFKLLMNDGEHDGPLDVPANIRLEIAMAISSPLKVKDYEAYGILPLRTNQYLAEQEYVENKKRMEKYIDVMLDIAGITPQEAKDFRPIVPEIIQQYEQMKIAGRSDGEILGEILDELSRRSMVSLFGVQSITDVRYELLSDEDIAKAQETFINEEAKATLIAQLLGITLTPEQVAEFVIYGRRAFTNEQLEMLGLPRNYTIPNRTDVRTDAEVANDTLNLINAAPLPDDIRSVIPQSLTPGDQDYSQMIPQGLFGSE